jgi:hypothetical protein
MAKPYSKAQLLFTTTTLSAKNGGDTGNAVFKINDEDQTGVTYTITDQDSLPTGITFTSSTGKLAVAANTNFAGGNYIIKADKGGTTASAQIYIQANV